MGCWGQQLTLRRFYSKELDYMEKNNRVTENIVNSLFAILFMTQHKFTLLKEPSVWFPISNLINIYSSGDTMNRNYN